MGLKLFPDDKHEIELGDHDEASLQPLLDRRHELPPITDEEHTLEVSRILGMELKTDNEDGTNDNDGDDDDDETVLAAIKEHEESGVKHVPRDPSKTKLPT